MREISKFREFTRRIFVIPILIYRKFISPLFPPCCRYTPTCSEYAVEAICKHGIIRGSWLTFRRLLRCNPWSCGGYDPVPPIKPKN